MPKQQRSFIHAVGYQVIARKYRPKRFTEVVGQDHVVRALTNAIRLNRIGHAYIFCGPRGTGKTTIARIFAKCLNCTNGPSIDYPDDDPRCIEIDEGRSLDVLEIDGASNNGVEQVRELRETVRFAPVSSRFKIYIIDEVHMLTTAAFNALLKTLEEPPAHVKFFFATTDPEKVLPTILSRCQRFDLRKIPAPLIVEHLKKIVQLEGVTAEPAALMSIARYADGCLRDALSALDQLISFCGETIRAEDVERVFGLPSKDQVFALAEAMLNGNAEIILQIIDRLEHEGKELGAVLTALIQYLHDLLVYQYTKRVEGAVFASELDKLQLDNCAKRVSAQALVRMIEVLSQTESRIRFAVSKRITLEVALLRASELREAISIPELVRELRELQSPQKAFEHAAAIRSAPGTADPQRISSQQRLTTDSTDQALNGAAVASPDSPKSSDAHNNMAWSKAHPTISPNTQPPPMAARPTPPGELDQLSNKLIEALRKRKLAAASYLAEAKCVAIENGVLTIELPERFKDRLPLFQSPRTYKTMIHVLQELGYHVESIRFRVQPQLNQVAPSVNQLAQTLRANSLKNHARSGIDRVDLESLKNDPAINEALELFRAKIVKITPSPNGQPPNGNNG